MWRRNLAQTVVTQRRCSLSKEVFDTDRGLWLATSQNELYPNPHSYATEREWRRFLSMRRSTLTSYCFTAHQLEWYSFIGRVLGKAMYEGILVDVSFAGFFCEARWNSQGQRRN